MGQREGRAKGGWDGGGTSRREAGRKLGGTKGIIILDTLNNVLTKQDEVSLQTENYNQNFIVIYTCSCWITSSKLST